MTEPGPETIAAERFDRVQQRFGRWMAREARELKPGGRRRVLRDMLAGVTGAVASVPDGMAAGVLAGVNPAHGLYASIGGPIAGGLTSSTRMMIVATTGAAALAAGSAIESYPDDQRSGAIILLTVITGLVLLLVALLRLSRFLRYVSYSVTLGFLTGISLNLILSQTPDLLGVEAPSGLSLTKFIYAVTHPGEIVWASTGIGAAALILLITLDRTRLAPISALLALIVPTAAVHLLGLDSVALVKDVGAIPHGVPLPRLPDLNLLTPGLAAGGFAVAALTIIQGAGVAEAAPNSDGSISSARRDVSAQGLGNVASGLVGGMPVGGSVGQTALNVAAGAQTRWASIWSGVWMIAILLLFARLVGEVAMPTLAAVLIYAGASSIRPKEVIAVARAGRIPAIAVIATFVAVLVLPVAPAVGVGVLASLILQLNQEGLDLRLVQLRRGPHGELIEDEVPESVGHGEVLILNAYGSLFFAGARTLQRLLPTPRNAADTPDDIPDDAESPTDQVHDERLPGPVVILRLRGRTTLGATFLKVISRYAQTLETADGELDLSGVEPAVARRWTADVKEDARLITGIKLFPATPVLGEATLAALAAGQNRWLDDPDEPHRVRPADSDQ